MKRLWLSSFALMAIFAMAGCNQETELNETTARSALAKGAGEDEIHPMFGKL